MSKTALVFGSTGQDGSYITEELLKFNFNVYGVSRKDTSYLCDNSQYIHVKSDITNYKFVSELIKKIRPDEIYNFAGITTLSEAQRNKDKTLAANYFSLKNIIKSATDINSKVKILQASSSEVFSMSNKKINEESERTLSSDNFYAYSKNLSDQLIQEYRSKGFFCNSAILFNHESPRRGEASVLGKITSSMVRIKFGYQSTLWIGNLYTSRDWGYAGDYVNGIRKMMKNKKPDDYIFASGKKNSLLAAFNFCEEYLNMKINWEGDGINKVGLNDKGDKIIITNPSLQKSNRSGLVGDSSKAMSSLGWKKNIDFFDLLKILLDHYYQKYK